MNTTRATFFRARVSSVYPNFVFVAYGESVMLTLHPAVTVLLALVMVTLFFFVPVRIRRRTPFGLYDRMKDRHSATRHKVTP